MHLFLTGFLHRFRFDNGDITGITSSYFNCARIYSSVLLTNLNESRVIAMIATEAITPMIAMPLGVVPKVGSWLIICHVVGIREKPNTMAIIIPDIIACNSLICMFILLLFVVFNGYSSIL